MFQGRCAPREQGVSWRLYPAFAYRRSLLPHDLGLQVEFPLLPPGNISNISMKDKLINMRRLSLICNRSEMKEYNQDHSGAASESKKP